MELWEISYNKALVLKKNQNYEESSYYFVNAIGYAPGQLVLIKGFTDLLIEWAQQLEHQGDEVTSFQQLDRAESFLVNAVPFVKPEDLPEILILLKSINQLKEDNSSTPPSEEDPCEAQANNDLALYKEGKFNSSDHGSSKEIQQRLEKLLVVQQLLSSLPHDKLPDQTALDNDIIRLQRGFQFESLYEEASNLLLMARATKATAGAMILQNVENLARQLVTWPEIDDRQERIIDLLRKLKVESDRILDLSRNEDSEIAWNAFIKVHGTKIQDAKNWFTKKDSEIKGSSQQYIDELKDIMRVLQELLPRLNHLDIYRKAVSLAEELGLLMGQAANTQQMEYNKWVMSLLIEAMRKGDEYIGIIDNEKALAKSMVDILGPIDTRVLTQEVSRCYTEVFEHLFSHLDRPHTDKDFESEGSKLKLLKDLFEHSKRTMQDF
jgi:hypothetical protein